MKQRTIKQEVSIKGIGLHSGEIVQINILPAPVNHGFKFKRTDLTEKTLIPADANKVTATQRGTVIENERAKVSTVEHLLSAFHALHIHNALIEIDGAEVPIMDGSALPFIELLEKVGVQEQEVELDVIEITEPSTFKDEASGAEYILMPSDAFEANVIIDFNSPILGQQVANWKDTEHNYAKDIAPARTFVFVHELEYLADAGLIKGGNLDNAIVIANKEYSEEDLERLAKKLGKNSIKINQAGYLNTTPLRFSNEAARHKLLDLIGDLALCGKYIKGKVIAIKPGHKGNVELAKHLKKMFVEQRKLHGLPRYDPTQEPIKTTMDIAKMLPHRYPFLLVDKVIEMKENYIVGVKNITFNEAFFQGHFPGNPVFPGVLQMEALAQTGGILALNSVQDPWNWDTYFLKIDNAKFKAKVVPGDTILLKMELMEPIRRGIIRMQGTAYVGNKIVSEGELTAQIVRSRNQEHEPQ